MADIIVKTVGKAFVVERGDAEAEAARQAVRAQAAADRAEAASIGVRAFDEVVAATPIVAGRTVSIGDGRIARYDGVVPFGGSVTLDATASHVIVDEPHTLTFVNGQGYWSYLPARLAYGNVTQITVTDVASGAVLAESVDYILDRKLGALALKSAGPDRAVRISYTGSEERYDLICCDPEFHVLYKVPGGVGIRDAAERIPTTGTKNGQSSIPMRMPLFHARTAGDRVDLVKLWNIRDGIAREYEAQVAADLRRNREAIRPFLQMVEAGQGTVWSSNGDSISAIQSEEPSLTVPDGPYRDRATAAGATYGYLREGIIAPSLIDAVRDDYDHGDGAGPVHTHFGRMWELVAACAGPVTYRNYSVAGTNSDDSPDGMTDPARLAAWAQDGSDLGIILDGMNSRNVGVTLLFNRIRQLIDAKYSGGAKGVIVWGCSRPNDIGSDVTDFLTVNRVLRQAAMTPGWGGRTAAFIDPTLVSYGAGMGSMGIVATDYCLANAASHPGIRQHRIEGDLGRRVIFG